MEEKKTPVPIKPGKVVSQSPFIDPGTLLKNSWEVYKSNWSRYVFLSSLPYLSIVPFAAVAALLALIGFFFYNSHNYTALVLIGTVGIILAVIYFSVTFSIGGVALIYLIHDRGRMSIEESMKKGWGIIWSYWWLGFLISLLTFGGYLLFIIPGIILSVWFTFGIYVLVVEGITGMDALVKSREYVRGNWWGVLGRMLLVSIIVYIVSSVISFVPQIIFHAMHKDALSSLLQIFISFAIAPFSTIYMILMYEDLKTSRPDVSTIPAKGKGAYIVVAILGFVMMLVFVYFGVRAGVELLRDLPDNYYKTAPNLQNKELPNFTGSPDIFSQLGARVGI